jgi:ABC-type nitrate/sulfonate/bicarbonate transport system ATPase subunit/ABC-type nitrate/sulfonate/bicarbonate transport system permease component
MPDKVPARRAVPLRLRLLSVVGVALILAGWAVASLAAGVYFVPAPWTTIADTALLLARGHAWTQILITFLRVCAGFLGGFLTGIVAGMAIGARKELDALFKPLVLFFQGMPPLLWAIPLVALMGIGHLPTIVVIGLITFPLVAVTIGEGMSTLPREYREMLAIFAPGFAPRTRELVLPHLAPFLGASLKAGLVLAVKASVTAEYFGANDGIGFQIQAAYMSMRIRALFSWAAVLILVILVFNHLLPKIRLAWPAFRRLFQHKGPIVCSREDIEELRRAFTSLTVASRIALHRVSFAYKKRSVILQDVDLEVGSHEIVVVTGESGIGKTTLLKAVASLLKPSKGSISCPPRIGFVFQDDRLLPWRTVAQNTALPLLYQGFPRKNALCFAHYLLSEAGMAGEEEKKPEELSGGMKKRAALARCFARLPDAILLDEPFSGLHGEARAVLWDMFLRLLALHPVPALIVTHYPEEISSLASCSLYALEGRPGRIVAVKR